MRRRSAKPVRDCQDLSPPQPALPSACGAGRSYCRETLPSSAGRYRTDDYKTAWPRHPKSVQPWQNCPEPVRLVSASLQFSTRSNETVLRVDDANALVFGGLNRSPQHFILEGKDGVWDGTEIS